MTDQNDAMNSSWDELPEDVATPRGTYILQCRSVAEVKAKEAGQSNKLLITHTPVEAMSDVDEEKMLELEAAGIDYRDNEIVTTVWLGKNKDWHKLKRMIEAHGIDLADFAGKPKKDAIMAMKGKKVLATVSTRTYESQGEPRSEDQASNFKSVDAE